jgi:hypothetical protein
MAQHDYNIANASFPTVRSDINDVLSAINTSNSGTSRPSGVVAGTIWLDTSGGVTANILKFYDGGADINLATINTTANTVDWADSSISLADDSVTLAKMASGTDGNIISYDASGNPVAVATGNDGQVLTSAGAGAVCAFETLPITALNNATANELVTVGSTTTELDAEANLTFDGSTLAVTGAITATGDVTAFSTSDKSLKQNIINIDSSLDKVSQLNGVYYNWTQEALEKNKHLDDKKEVGVIAQDVEKVLPEIVATRKDGTKAVKYERLCAVLIEAVKELQEQIKDLKKGS